MRLVAAGDSWCWGAELVDPAVEPVPIMNLPGGGFERQSKPENLAYRLKYRYINQFAEKINADELIDLSSPSLSNDSIVRILFDWLSKEGYLTGRDTSDLFVSIGWTSPERREFYWKNQWGGDNYIPFGPWSMDQKHCSPANGEHVPELDQFFRLYFDHFWNEAEFIHRWILHVWQTEQLLKKFNIKYIMHQAFYHHYQEMIYQWEDRRYVEKFDIVTPGDKILWENVDHVRFIHKNDVNAGTAHHYMLSKGTPEEMFIIFHPSAEGHTVWADHLHEYCMENKLL
jgi:hypothetical protein